MREEGRRKKGAGAAEGPPEKLLSWRLAHQHARRNNQRPTTNNKTTNNNDTTQATSRRSWRCPSRWPSRSKSSSRRRAAASPRSRGARRTTSCSARGLCAICAQIWGGPRRAPRVGVGRRAMCVRARVRDLCRPPFLGGKEAGPLSFLVGALALARRRRDPLGGSGGRSADEREPPALYIATSTSAAALSLFPDLSLSPPAAGRKGSLILSAALLSLPFCCCAFSFFPRRGGALRCPPPRLLHHPLVAVVEAMHIDTYEAFDIRWQSKIFDFGNMSRGGAAPPGSAAARCGTAPSAMVIGKSTGFGRFQKPCFFIQYRYTRQ